jgi:hypothetical protein
MPYLQQVVDEVKRTCPNVPMSFGRAKRAIEVAGYTIPQDWLVMMAVHASNLDPVFSSPETFDPDRFSPERDEKKRAPDAFMPQGAGTLVQHKCAGYDFATVTMQLFRRSAPEGKWSLPAQDLSMKWVVPPEHKSGLSSPGRNPGAVSTSPQPFRLHAESAIEAQLEAQSTRLRARFEPLFAKTLEPQTCGRLRAWCVGFAPPLRSSVALLKEVPWNTEAVCADA